MTFCKESARPLRSLDSHISTEAEVLLQSALERREWKRFGDAVAQQPEHSVTVQSREDVPFERTKAQKSTRDEKQQLSLQSAMQSNDKNAVTAKYALPLHSCRLQLQNVQLNYVLPICSLKDMLYKRRMERQLAAARGEGPAPERAPDDVSNLAFVLVVRLFSSVCV